MTFQPRMRTPRDLGRRPAKAKAKMKTERRRADQSYLLEEQHAPTCGEVIERTLNSLRRLGSQRFAVAPFYEHYDRWLVSLRTVLGDLESSFGASADEQFTRESSQALTDIELALRQRRIEETSHEEAIRRINQNLLDARSLLAQTEREYARKAKELAGRKERTVKPMLSNAGRLREELNRIVKMRAGFLRGISKKTKAQKEAEASKRLDSTKQQLAKIERSFSSEQEKLQNEYEKRKQEILDEIADYQKEIENQEVGSQIDDALDVRRSACDILISAVNTFMQRTQASSDTTNASD